MRPSSPFHCGVRIEDASPHRRCDAAGRLLVSQDALKASYANLQKAITGLSDKDLQTRVKLFGEDMTKQDALMLILEDQHEHLGQSIAYARTNGVVPPWSK